MKKTEILKSKCLNSLAIKLIQTIKIDFFNDSTGERKHNKISYFLNEIEFVNSCSEDYLQKIQRLANIRVTEMCCAGHKKAELNEYAYNEEFKKLKLDNEPSDDLLSVLGEFNGQGSI